MNLKKLIKITFEKGNVCVDGLRGCGKDMLTANVIVRRNRPYVSNIDYKACLTSKSRSSVYIPLEFSKLDVNNNYKSLVGDNIIPYDYPYPENCDIYISDCGVYFPSQYNGELNKEYKNLPVFMALSRQLGQCNIHCNTQSLNRVWDKLREQSDIFIKCNWCKVLKCRLFKNIVIQKITIYDKQQSCIDRVEPYKHIKVPFLASKELRANLTMKNEEMLRRFKEDKGGVRSYILIYRNKSNYDTRLFKSILRG